MKVALLISGYLRSFKTNIPKVKEKIINNFDNVDVYIHITENEVSEDRYINKISDDDIIFIKESLQPIAIIQEPNIVCSEVKKVNDITNTWLKYYKLNQIKKNNEEEFGDYDLVIKYRPDMDILTDNLILEGGDYITIPIDSKIDRDKLTHKNDKYLCDIFAYGSSGLMDKYFSFYSNINSLTSEYGMTPETLLYHYLENNKIPYRLVDIDFNVILSSCNIFAIAGDSGSGKTTLGELLKHCFSDSLMLECDRYHKWERGDENWSRVTHLNPEANFLTKMNEDIYDLKIGKDVYQVNYDHKNGKFTEKEHLETSGNVIVCGLHSLYGYNDMYDLKIFIDTDVELTKKWKINRDVKERGHSIDKVLTQIDDRMSDFIKYVKPQKDKSDLIINFYEKNNIVSLNISIKNKFNTPHLINLLNNKGFKYDIKTTDIFTTFNFTNYKELNLWDGDMVMINGFYNYIIFIILNLI